jgi:predicted enzyme related to lactoylglutathione lyase
MHEVCHVEYGTKELLRLVRFYQEVFGWRKTMDNGDYIVLSPKEGPSVGFMVSPEGVPCPCVTNFIHCREINDLLVRVRAQGLEIVHEKSEVPGMGWFALFRDPDGNVVGLWTPVRKPTAGEKAPKKAPGKPAKKRASKPVKRQRRTSARKPAKASARKAPRKTARKPAARRAAKPARRAAGRRRR